MSIGVTNGHAEAGQRRWPFGQFKGQPLSTINSGYLRCVLQGEGWDDGLRADVADKLNRPSGPGDRLGWSGPWTDGA
jgi:hypothetical protein